jgi:hypothetical protein
MAENLKVRFDRMATSTLMKSFQDVSTFRD